MADQVHHHHIPLCEPSPVDQISPRLPRVGDRFESWDDFRTWSRRAAEARGFTLSQSQSKGSSGTIVLRCSRFKEPGTVGQKMAENGCEVVFKVMKARNGLEGFEVVHAVEEHNHPFGPDLPVGHRPGTTLSGQPPKRKKAKTSASGGGGATSDVGTSHSHHTATPPASSSSKPFLFDPYTGKPIRSSATPIPTTNTPSPPAPTHLQPPNTTTTLPNNPQSSLPRAPSSLSGTPRSHSSRAGSSRAAAAAAAANYPPAAIPQQPVEATTGGTPSLPSHPNAALPGGNQTPTPQQQQQQALKHYPPLSIRLSLKAQTSITEFLASLSPALAPYGPHFKWLGVHSPHDLLALIHALGEQELDLLLDEIDTCGIGAKGEGLSLDEKLLIMSGLRKLAIMHAKS